MVEAGFAPSGRGDPVAIIGPSGGTLARGLTRYTADEARDIDSRSLLDWFVSEQIEEEAVVSEILGRARLVNEDGSGILRLDAELGQSA